MGHLTSVKIVLNYRYTSFVYVCVVYNYPKNNLTLYVYKSPKACPCK